MNEESSPTQRRPVRRLHLERTQSFTRPITRREALCSAAVLFAGLIVVSYKYATPNPVGISARSRIAPAEDASRATAKRADSDPLGNISGSRS
jgi:hypothetical protein